MFARLRVSCGLMLQSLVRISVLSVSITFNVSRMSSRVWAPPRNMVWNGCSNTPPSAAISQNFSILCTTPTRPSTRGSWASCLSTCAGEGKAHNERLLTYIVHFMLVFTRVWYDHQTSTHTHARAHTDMHTHTLKLFQRRLTWHACEAGGRARSQNERKAFEEDCSSKQT